jgi:hypothetical protein
MNLRNGSGIKLHKKYKSVQMSMGGKIFKNNSLLSPYHKIE